MSSELVINSVETVPDWGQFGPEVQKIVLGRTPGDSGDEKKSLQLERLPDDFAARFPNLTHLYLWGIAGLRALPPLPAKLECLDLRGCVDLVSLPPLPETLETLVLDGCARLEGIGAPGREGWSKLRDLSAKDCVRLPEASLSRLLGAAPGLERLDFSGCTGLSRLEHWPGGLGRIELNDCGNLAGTLPAWPARLYRLGLRNAARLAELPGFGAESVIDYLDLAGTGGLAKLPRFGGKTPRTLFLHGSGVPLDTALMGESPETNVAEDVFADLGEARHGTTLDHEVKVILLGNGRAGKTSLARRLLGEAFDPEEESTHGIRLWSLDLPFNPVGEGEPESLARVNVWDFGGQHLYENTHRLFLQNRAVFVICGTDAGKGADAEGDEAARQSAVAHEDMIYGYDYWREQVEALGTDARGERPPVLVVTTKSDRNAPGGPWADSIRDVREEDRMEFSAVDGGPGVDRLREKLGIRVARVLGSKAERTLGLRPAGLKARWAGWKRADEAEWRRADTKRRAKPAHARLSLDQAMEEIRRDCPDGAYHERPELLLRRLHRAGFLYWNETTLRGEVILDQRWAIEGIYAVLNRSSRGYGELGRRNGLFEPSDLGDWAWNQAKYTLGEQELFLGFMESCGVAIRLLESYETGSQPCLLAPGFLPSAEQGGSPPPEHATLSQVVLQGVDSSVMVRFLGLVARHQRRELRCWKWGLQCNRITCEDGRVWVEMLWVQWEPRSPAGVTGEVEVKIIAADLGRSFYAKLVNEVVEGVRSAGRAAFPVRGGTFSGEGAAGGSLEAKQFPSRSEHAPLRQILNVNISFSGDPPGQPGPPVQPWRHTAFPDALRQALEAPGRASLGGFRVLDYQADEAKRISSLRMMIQQLITGDILVVVLSRKFLESEYCMEELLLLAGRLEKLGRPVNGPGSPAAGPHPSWAAEVWSSDRVRLYWLPDVVLAARTTDWEEQLLRHWVRRRREYLAEVSDKYHGSDTKAVTAIQRGAEGYRTLDDQTRERLPDLGPCVEWFAFCDDPARRRAVVDFLRALIQRNCLPPALLIDQGALAGYAESQADELAHLCRKFNLELSSAERSSRLVLELERAFSGAAGDQGTDQAPGLFHEWLKLNRSFERRFQADPFQDAPQELPPAIRQAWDLVAASRRGGHLRD